MYAILTQKLRRNAPADDFLGKPLKLDALLEKAGRLNRLAADIIEGC